MIKITIIRKKLFNIVLWALFFLSMSITFNYIFLSNIEQLISLIIGVLASIYIFFFIIYYVTEKGWYQYSKKTN